MYDSQAWDEDDWQMGGSPAQDSWGADDTWWPDQDSKMDEWADDDKWQADPAQWHAHDAVSYTHLTLPTMRTV